MRTRVARLLVPIVIALTGVGPLVAAGDVPVANDAPSAEVPGARYDALFSLDCTGEPTAHLLVGSGSAEGLVVQLTTTSAAVCSLSSPGGAEIVAHKGTALPANGTVTVRVRRRDWDVRVDVDGRPLVRCAAAPGTEGTIGIATASSGCALKDLVVQPLAPIAFADEFSPDEDPAESWEALSGTWKMGTYRDALIARDGGPATASWYEASGDSCVAATGQDFWEDYSIEVSARTSHGSVGIVDGLSEGQTPVVLELLPSAETAACRLVRGTSGGEEIARATCRAEPGRWHRLRLEVTEAGARGYIDDQPLLSATGANAVSSGRAGLYATGGPAEFDDVLVASLEQFDASHAQPPDRLFSVLTGDWRFGAEGVVASPSSYAIALARTPEWPDAEARCQVEAVEGAEAGVMAGVLRRGYGYALGVRREASSLAWRLRWLESGSPVVLAEGMLPNAMSAEVGVALRLCGPRIEARVAGEVVATDYDFRQRGGRVGLFADGHAPVRFAGCQAEAVSDNAYVIGWLDGTPATVPDPSQSGDVKLPVIGYLWKPLEGGLSCGQSDGEPVLIPDAGPGRRGLAYREPAAGDVEMDATVVDPAAEGTVGLSLFADGLREPGAYELRLHCGGTLRAELLRAGEVVKSAELSAPSQGPLPVRLRCDGAHIVGVIGDTQLPLADAEPVRSGFASVYVEGEKPSPIDSLELRARTAQAYSFRKVAPEWDPEEGEWTTHSGMSCIPWDYWITGDGAPRALLVHRRTTADDCLVRVSACEYTEGYGTGEHRHFPYHDFGVTLGYREGVADSGYRFLIGADRGKGIRLYRDGEVVASVDDPRFHISLGGHCNTPRSMDIVVHKIGPHLTLRLQGELVLSYDDPQTPLPAGHVALSVEDCRTNFRDLVVYDELCRPNP